MMYILTYSRILGDLHLRPVKIINQLLRNFLVWGPIIQIFKKDNYLYLPAVQSKAESKAKKTF